MSGPSTNGNATGGAQAGTPPEQSAQPSPRLGGKSPGEIRWLYTTAELWADGVVHVVGIALAAIGAIWLLSVVPHAASGETMAVAIYVATLALAIVCSAAYNMWPVSRTKWFLRRLDHSAIYLLIAGTYTPFMFRLKTWWLLAFVWIVAAAGIALKLGKPGRFDRASIGLCLALGWSAFLILGRVVSTLDPATLWLIGIGGVLYSLGIIFHLWERLRFQNAIWHGFVLTAATAHYSAVWSLISGPPA